MAAIWRREDAWDCLVLVHTVMTVNRQLTYMDGWMDGLFYFLSYCAFTALNRRITTITTYFERPVPQTCQTQEAVVFFNWSLHSPCHFFKGPLKCWLSPNMVSTEAAPLHTSPIQLPVYTSSRCGATLAFKLVFLSTWWMSSQVRSNFICIALVHNKRYLITQLSRSIP